jgi:hypothetical protein
MESFSERIGISSKKTSLQLSDMDSDLRNSLWNVIYPFLNSLNYPPKKKKGSSEFMIGFQSRQLFICLRIIWVRYYKSPLDEIPYKDSGDAFKVIKAQFFNEKWNGVYDFIEFLLSLNYPPRFRKNFSRFVIGLNGVLKRELSGYRILGKHLVPITNKTEIELVEKVLSSPLKPINEHITRAIKLMSDRKNPDYRNSIKESISAVEAIATKIAGKKVSGLDAALKIVDSKVKLHGALKQAFCSLYGYTSDSSGIRHALLDDKDGLDFEDAEYMLVTCSSFVNYLLIKCQKANISLE